MRQPLNNRLLLLQNLKKTLVIKVLLKLHIAALHPWKKAAQAYRAAKKPEKYAIFLENCR